MPSCPFCKGEVAAALTRDGGPCPHCLNVIPGEDAATDPGAAQRAREAATQAAAARARRRWSILLGAVVLLSVAGGIGYSEHQRRQQYAVLELSIEWGDYFVLSPEELAAASAPDDPVAEAAPPVAAPPRGPRRPREDEPDLQAGADARLGPTPDDPSRVEAPAAPGALPGPGPVVLKGGPAGAVPVHERPVLTSQVEIDRMVKEQMRTNRADIKRCYEAALRLDDTLSGRWTFEFVILSSGATDQIKVTGDRMKSESLEACFAREVRGWTFQRIDKPMPVSFSVPLGT